MESIKRGYRFSDQRGYGRSYGNRDRKTVQKGNEFQHILFKEMGRLENKGRGNKKAVQV